MVADFVSEIGNVQICIAEVARMINYKFITLICQSSMKEIALNLIMEGQFLQAQCVQ